jgi:hypothetical protein
MSRPDPRARIANDQRKRAEVEQRFAAARKGDSLRSTIEKAAASSRPPAPRQAPLQERVARGSAELAAFARRLTPADLQTIDVLHSRGGWPAVAQALSQAGLGTDALGLATTVAQRGGLPELGRMVTERIQHEDRASLQASANQELIGFARQLTPEQVGLVERIAAERGWGAVDAELAAAGLSEAARMVAFRTVEAGGLPGLGKAITQHIQHEDTRSAESEASRRTIEQWTAKDDDSPRARAMKESSPIAKMLRDPNFHAAAEGMAQRLVAAGLEKPAGKSAAQWVVDTLHTLDGGRVVDGMRQPFDPAWSEEKRTAAVTELLGAASSAEARRVLSMFETARIEHRTLDRMAKMDAKRPGTPAKVAPAAAPVNDLRATIEKAAAKRGATKEQPVAVGSALGATIAFAAGRKAELATTYAEKDTQRMADGIDPKPDNSLRGDIERAMAMDAEQDDTEETEGGADE